ncbi:hypothetical protein G6F61_013913 [Rhizopus arrhizus]|nr:hypothetical protein G6F61_013913 [Rhizopus arrhizus]
MSGPLRPWSRAGRAGQGAGAGPALAGGAGDPVLPRGGRRGGDSVRRDHRPSGCAPAGGRQAALPAGDAGRPARARNPAGAFDRPHRQPRAGAAASAGAADGRAGDVLHAAGLTRCLPAAVPRTAHREDL